MSRFQKIISAKKTHYNFWILFTNSMTIQNNLQTKGFNNHKVPKLKAQKNYLDIAYVIVINSFDLCTANSLALVPNLPNSKRHFHLLHSNGNYIAESTGKWVTF